MAKAHYIGVSGISKKGKQLYVGVNGVARKTKTGFVGVNGIARVFFSGGIPLSQYSVGSVVKIKENGTPVEFYVAKHNYESGWNGSGRTLLVRKYLHSTRAWNSSGINALSGSSIDTWLNGTYKNTLDASVQAAIGTTTFIYTPGNGVSNTSTLSRAVFLLSGTEIGCDGGAMNVEGSILPISSTLMIASLNGTNKTQWTRSAESRGNYRVWTMNERGNTNIAYSDNTLHAARPCFTLPADTPVNESTNIVLG